MSHFLKTLGLENYITSIFVCFNQRLRFSYWSEKNICPKQLLFTKPSIIFTLFVSATGELENTYENR